MPTSLRVLHGDKPYRINNAEPKPRDVLPTQPDWLSPLAATEWKRVMPDVKAMGTVKAVDTMALACYCEAVGRFRQATKLITETSLVLRGREGQVVKNPAVAQARDASVEIRMWARELGFTASARQPLRVEHMGDGLAGARLLSG